MDANKKRISERVIACAFEVSNSLGVGFLESVYGNALAVEFSRQKLSFEREKPLAISYKGIGVGNYFADFMVENALIVEIKALSSLTREHEAQVLNYLRATGVTVGLLLNFGTPRMGIKRLVWGHADDGKI